MQQVLDLVEIVIHTASRDSLLTLPTMTLRIRTTISVSLETYEIFKRMAAAGNMSVSRCMGDWLTDTGEAAEMITSKMEDAKRAPMRVMRELKAMVAGMGGEVDTVMEGLREQRSATTNAPPERQRRRSGSETQADVKPPSSNTGVLVPPVPPVPLSSRRVKLGRKL